MFHRKAKKVKEKKAKFPVKDPNAEPAINEEDPDDWRRVYDYDEVKGYTSTVVKEPLEQARDHLVYISKLFAHFAEKGKSKEKKELAQKLHENLEDSVSILDQKKISTDKKINALAQAIALISTTRRKVYGREPIERGNASNPISLANIFIECEERIKSMQGLVKNRSFKQEPVEVHWRSFEDAAILLQAMCEQFALFAAKGEAEQRKELANQVAKELTAKIDYIQGKGLGEHASREDKIIMINLAIDTIRDAQKQVYGDDEVKRGLWSKVKKGVKSQLWPKETQVSIANIFLDCNKKIEELKALDPHFKGTGLQIKKK